MKARTRLLFPFLLLVGILIAETKGPNTYEYILVGSAKNEYQRSNEAFDKMMDVLTHQRCMNCHPNDDIPKTGEMIDIHIILKWPGETTIWVSRYQMHYLSPV